MRFLFKSDLHLDFLFPSHENEEKLEFDVRQYARQMYHNSAFGEVLPVFLAGDYANENRYTIWFFDEIAKHAEHVFYVIGNDDLFLEKYEHQRQYAFSSRSRLVELIEELSKIHNITLLDYFDVIEYKGYKIAGSVNWYKLDHFEQRAEFGMIPDSLLIKDFDISARGHLEDEAWYRLDEVDIVMTHFPPIYLYGHSKTGVLCNKTSRNIKKAKVWLTGHIHEVHEYQEGDTWVLVNANGYPSEFESIGMAHVFGQYQL